MGEDGFIGSYWESTVEFSGFIDDAVYLNYLLVQESILAVCIFRTSFERHRRVNGSREGVGNVLLMQV